MKTGFVITYMYVAQLFARLVVVGRHSGDCSTLFKGSYSKNIVLSYLLSKRKLNKRIQMSRYDYSRQT